MSSLSWSSNKFTIKQIKVGTTLMKKFKHYLALALGALLLLFAVQNMGSVELNFLFWSFQSRRIVVIILAVITGLIIGMIIGAHKNREEGKTRED